MYNPRLNKSGKPQEYKSILFHPLKIKDEEYYDWLISFLSYNKNSIPDVKILKMSYLKFFVLYLSDGYSENATTKFQDILSYITGCNVVLMYKQTQSSETDEYKSNVEFYITFDEIEVSEWEFDSIREILLEQNGVTLNFVNSYDASLEEHLKFVHRNNKSGTFEEQIFSYCAYMRIPINIVEETHTFYQFNKMMSRIRMLLTFELYKPLEASGQISIKDGEIEDWLSHLPERGRYDDILVKRETFTQNNDLFKVAQTK